MTVAAGIVFARIALAAIFAAAGLAKIRDRDGTARAARDLGAPEMLAPFVAAVLPFAELGLSITLVVDASARAAAAGAALLLVVFGAAVAYALSHGRRPDCNCFGAAGSSAIGAHTLGRNAVLAALAITVAAAQPVALSWRPALVSAAAVAAAAQAWLWVELLRRYGRALRDLENGAVHRMSVGSEAPRFVLPQLGGPIVGLDDLLTPSRSLVLLFIHSGCSACDRIMHLARSSRATRVVVVAAGPRADVAAKTRGLAPESVLLDEEGELVKRYGWLGFPSAVHLDDDAVVLAGPAVGAEAVADLLSGLAEPLLVEGAA